MTTTRQRSLLLPLSIACALAFGCAPLVTRVGDLTLIANQNVDGLPKPIAGRQTGQNCTHDGRPPSLEEAIDFALKDTGGTALANATLTSEQHWNGYLCFTVTGDRVDLSVKK